MNYSNIGNLPKNGPGTNNLDGWTALFKALMSQDDLLILKSLGWWRYGWVQAPEVLAVQDPFFDIVLAQNYSKYFEIDTVNNVVQKMKPEIKNIGSNEAIALYDLCLKYAKNVLSAIRTARLKNITPYDPKNAWMYGKGNEDQNRKFAEIRAISQEPGKLSSPSAIWVSTAIQMNIDGCLYSASKNETARQGNMEWNIILLIRYSIQGYVTGYAQSPTVKAAIPTFNMSIDTDVPANVPAYWGPMAQNEAYLSYDPTTKSNAYIGNFLINPL